MPYLTHREREEFLHKPGQLVRVACVRPDGSPLVTPIWYIFDEGAICFTPRAKSEWFGCLRKDPRVSLCIDEESQPYRKIVVDGETELLHDLGDDDLWRDLYRRIACRYIPPDAAEIYIQNTIDQPRGLFRVVLGKSRIRSWRMPMQGEPAEGIWHDRYYAEDTKFKAKSGSPASG